MDMIHSSEFQQLPLAAQYFSLAHAYLDASTVLCDAMLQDDGTAEYSDTRVILHLCRQAAELFLKGALSSVTNVHPRGHNLAKLMAEYERVLPDPQFRFEVPFGIVELGSPCLGAEFAENHHRTLDQRYRYPTDNTGKPFSDPEGFIPLSFMFELQGLAKAFLTVEARIQRLL